MFWCRTASRSSSPWTSARPKFRTAPANWAGASAWKFQAHAADPRLPNIQRTLQVEVYDDFPNLLLSSAEYKNTGTAGYPHRSRAIEQQHKFNASLAEKKAQPYDMWSFHGASYDWGKDDVIKLGRNFAQPNAMGADVKGGYGGGIPVVAFWTGTVGEAVGHVETFR